MVLAGSPAWGLVDEFRYQSVKKLSRRGRNAGQELAWRSVLVNFVRESGGGVWLL